MKKIQSFSPKNLRNEEDFGFQKQILAETESLTAETDKQMVATYKAAVDGLDAALQVAQGSSLTAALTEADQRADEAWSGLNATVKAQLGHPVEANREAAEEAAAILKKYGNPTSLPYNEEYGSLHNLLQDLTAFGTDKQKLCYIDAWVTELQTRYDEFTALRGERTAEEGAKVQGAVKTARTACDEAYKTLVACVNALAILQGETAYATFIDNVNVIIDDAKSTLAARKTRSKAGSSAKIAPSQSQPAE